MSINQPVPSRRFATVLPWVLAALFACTTLLLLRFSFPLVLMTTSRTAFSAALDDLQSGRIHIDSPLDSKINHWNATRLPVMFKTTSGQNSAGSVLMLMHSHSIISVYELQGKAVAAHLVTLGDGLDEWLFCDPIRMSALLGAGPT